MTPHDDEQTVAERDGTARVFNRGSQAAIVFALSEYERVKAAWKAGAAFVDALGIYGEPITLKLAEVWAMDANDAACMAAWDADKAIERRRDAARDLTGEG